jgi:hypothetical protein
MTIKVSIGISKERDYVKAVKEAAMLAKAGLYEEKIDLIIIFSTASFAHPNTIKTINNLFPEIPLIGCSGMAIITKEGIHKQGLALMLLSISQNLYFNTACVSEITNKTPLEAGIELGDKLMYGFKNIRRDMAILFCDGLIKNGSSLINGLQEKLGKSLPMIGASASDNLLFHKTHIYFNQGVFNDACCGIIWGGKLNFGIGAQHGWKPLGKPHTATTARGDVIEKIDGLPAAKMYEDYLGYTRDRLKEELKLISVLYPLGMFVPGEEEYLLRNILSIENDGSMHLQGNIIEGAQIRLMIGNKDTCLEATRHALKETTVTFKEKGINFALIFDSISRYILLGRDAEKELEIIKAALGKETPFLGIYTYGEQAPLKAMNYQGQAYFQNQTISVLAMGAN